MTSHRADDLNGRIDQADGALSGNDDWNAEGIGDRAASTVQAVVAQDCWHYYHVSTP